MKTTAEQFKKLLPALQHLAKFPSCNHAAICTRNGVLLAEVMAVITEVCGSMSLWDEDYLAKAARELRVTVPAYVPGAPRSAPVSGASVKTVTAGGTKLGEGKSVDEVMTARIEERKDVVKKAREVLGLDVPTALPPVREVVADGRRGRRPIKPKFVAVLRALIDNPKLTENQAVQRCGIRGGSWSYFKSTRLGLGPIDLAKARALLEAENVATEPARAKVPIADCRLPIVSERPAAEGVTECSVVEQINALLVGYRVEVVSVRLVPIQP